MDPESFVFANSAVTGAIACVRAFTVPGDSILVLTPLYGRLQTLVEGEGRRLVRQSLATVPMELPQGGGAPPVRTAAFGIDFERLEANIRSERVRMLLFCNPHNPGGRAWLPAELRELVQICRRHGVLIVSDEVHMDWCLFGNRHTPVATVARPDEVVTLGGPGKAFWIQGLQASFVALEDEALRARYQAVVAHTAESEGSVFATAGMLAAYTSGGAWLESAKAYIEGNVMEVEGFLARHLPEVRAWHPMATFLVWLDLG